tara:strand:- start:129 stop:353 length:225 start_codon:yes stop_codon:yes gene_type:complete
MKSSGTSNIRKKLISKYLLKEQIANNTKIKEIKRTDINILLNRVKLNQKNESKKKIYFSAAASLGLVLFGALIF